MCFSEKDRTRLSIGKIFALIAVAMCGIMVAACGGGSDGNGNTGRIDSLRRLDDSVVALSPTALPTIRHGLATAHDSTAYYEYSLRLARYYWLSEHPERADTLVGKVMAYVERQDNGYYARHKTCSSPRLNSLMAGAVSCRAARYHNFHRDTKKTIALYHSAYSLLQNSESKFDLPKTCANLADAYILDNDLPKAGRWYRRALFLVDSLRLPQRENITLYMGLAQIYVSLNNFDRAKFYYNETERYFRQMSPSMQAYYINNLGNFYYYSKDYSKALATFIRMKRLLESRGMQRNFDMYLCKVNLADVYLNLHRLDSSERCLDEAEHFFREKGDKAAIYYCNTIRFGIAVQKGDMAAARNILAGEGDNSDIPYTMVNIRSEYMQRYYERTGNYREAYNNLRESMAYTDSLEHNRSSMRTAEIMSRFTADTLQLHHELAIEHKNVAIQHANFTKIVAMSVAMVLALLLVIWYMYARKKSFESQMNIMNLKLNIVRNRISPHFMFNVLNNKIVNSGKQEASELMELARLIRANLDMSSMPCITLDKELEFVNQYIRVEHYLLGDDFSFEMEVEEGLDTSTVRIPSMFLQILTENAIVHGLKGLDRPKTLRVEIRRDGPMTVIRVSDNGPGFNARRTLKKGTGLGIISQTIAVVNERNKGKMRFEMRNSEDGEGNVTGCVATLRVPDNVKF